MHNELAVQQGAAMVPAQDNSIGSTIQWAMQNGATIEQMRELYAFQREVKTDQAREAFNRAFTAFKAEKFSIIRDKENSQFTKGEKKAMYVSLESMVATVTPFLSKHDLSAAWSTPSQTEKSMTIACTLTHILGHSQTETVTGPIDDSGAKNKLQQLKSTTTYLKALTFESVCGLASAFGNLSDDGNSAGKPDGRLEAEDVTERLDYIRASSTPEEVEKFYNAAMTAAEAIEDRESAKSFLAAKKRRLREIREEASA